MARIAQKYDINLSDLTSMSNIAHEMSSGHSSMGEYPRAISPPVVCIWSLFHRRMSFRCVVLFRKRRIISQTTPLPTPTPLPTNLRILRRHRRHHTIARFDRYKLVYGKHTPLPTQRKKQRKRHGHPLVGGHRQAMMSCLKPQ